MQIASRHNSKKQKKKSSSCLTRIGSSRSNNWKNSSRKTLKKDSLNYSEKIFLYAHSYETKYNNCTYKLLKAMLQAVAEEEPVSLMNQSSSSHPKRKRKTRPISKSRQYCPRTSLRQKFMLYFKSLQTSHQSRSKHTSPKSYNSAKK